MKYIQKINLFSAMIATLPGRLALSLVLFGLLLNCKFYHVQTGSHSPGTISSDSTRVILLNKDSVNMAIARSSELKIMRDAGIPGTIILSIFVDSNGQYRGNFVLQSPHPIATAAIVKLVPSMRFEIVRGLDHQPGSIGIITTRFLRHGEIEKVAP